MKIEKIHIKKFRGFKNVNFSLGSSLTIIAGQNGTQKTTLLGLLSQPFSITDKQNPLYNEKPLCGGNFKSAFAEKFKLSDIHDKPKQHEWSLFLKGDASPFVIESIPRDKGNIRFWKKGDRSKGSGYLPLPVIYLSLNRLIPLGEDAKIDVTDIELTKEEIEFCVFWHKKILIILDDFKKSDYLESTLKNTLGVSTDFYDWKQNSAGQDNIGKILLAILSFKRLKEKHSDTYSGGILTIDEIDATLYPASQEKLIDALSRFASDYNLQKIFTTHSLSILEHLDKKPDRQKEKNKIILLKKQNAKVIAIENCSFQDITASLNAAKSEEVVENNLMIFSEDDESRCFIKQLLGISITKKLKILDCNLGGESLMHLAENKVPGFCSPDSIVILDGDKNQKIKPKLNNFLCLPGIKSPEKLLAEYLFNLDDTDKLWGNINRNYTKQVCFRDFSLKEINSDRVKAKKWFTELKKDAGRNAYKVINPWKKENKKDTNNFIKSFLEIYNEIAIKLNLVVIGYRINKEGEIHVL